jgi:hypothetical protein
VILSILKYDGSIFIILFESNYYIIVLTIEFILFKSYCLSPCHKPKSWLFMACLKSNKAYTGSLSSP